MQDATLYTGQKQNKAAAAFYIQIKIVFFSLHSCSVFWFPIRPTSLKLIIEEVVRLSTFFDYYLYGAA